MVAYPQAGYEVGDIVAYKVPTGEIGAGHLVVHRISAVTRAGFELQGDNNPASDPWIATAADLVGQVVVRVPAVGPGPGLCASAGDCRRFCGGVRGHVLRVALDVASAFTAASIRDRSAVR